MLILWTIHLPNDLCPTYLSARLPLSAVGERDTYRIHMEYAVCVVLSCMGYELYIFWFSHILGGLWYIFPFFGSRASLFIRFHSIELFDHVIKRQWQKYNNEIDKELWDLFIAKMRARTHVHWLECIEARNGKFMWWHNNDLCSSRMNFFFSIIVENPLQFVSVLILPIWFFHHQKLKSKWFFYSISF